MDEIGFDLYGPNSMAAHQRVSRPIEELDFKNIQQVEIVDFLKKFLWRLNQSKEKFE